MLTILGSKSLEANNYRINEDRANNGRGYCGKHMHVHIWKHMYSKASANNIVLFALSYLQFKCSIKGLPFFVNQSKTLV